MACLFAGILLFFILLTQIWYPFESLYRYDFLFIVALLIQAVLLAFRLETPREAMVIVVPPSGGYRDGNLQNFSRNQLLALPR